jgi:FkbM family methyltransferase
LSFISYAQNFEDVMIWRALKHVENGFYIDVGANDPTLYSVTRACYDKGWHGINLEPVAEFFNRLVAQRSRDTNLQVGAGEVAGSFPFFDIPDTGLATSDPAVAQKHRDGGWEVNTIEIPVLPLADICNRHVSGEIHFLKIDVEGAEKQVLLGMDFKKWRPWLIIIEATAPMSQETLHQSWEFLLTDSDYEFVYFDGLNRYYVAQEHAELKPAFATPPNVFDSFVLNVDQEAKSRVAEAERIARRAQLHAQAMERATAEAERKTAQAELVAVQATEQAKAAQQAETNARAQTDLVALQNAALSAQLAATLASTSWRMTQPYRLLASKLKAKQSKP